MKHIFIIFIFLLSTDALAQSDGITLQGTRLIYDEAKKEVSIGISNQGESVPQLIQAWVSSWKGNSADVPFIITPPIYKLSKNSKATVRVVYIKSDKFNLPQDRESLFLLNIRSIPAVKKENNPHRFTVSTQNIIKLIFRPKGLISDKAGLAGEEIVISRFQKGIKFHNPTPYVVSITGIKINDKATNKNLTLLPYSDSIIDNLYEISGSIKYQSINDYGGTQSISKKVL